MSDRQIKLWMFRKMMAGILQRDRNRFNSGDAITFAALMGAGAGLMYLLDPDRGRRRRALLKDSAAHTFNQTRCALGTTSRDLANRARGFAARTTALFRSDEADDEVIEARVRSKLGRVVSHPGAIEVRARDGRVTLTGSVLAREVDDLVSCISSVRGVGEVDNQLQVHSQAGEVPELQGGRRRPGEQFELMQHNWSPSARLLATLTGGALMGVCLRRRDAVGVTLGTIGFGLALRGISNIELKRLSGFGGGRRAIDVCKTININAPVARVFEFWTNYENFPHFMHYVREVRDLGNGRSHWIVSGPAGVPVEWNAVVTDFQPGRVMAWKSEDNSIIQHAGIIRFEASGDNRTRVSIRLSYNPPAGAFGHALARIFGADPKHEMDEDLIRLKTVIETGHAPRDAAQPLPEVAVSARGIHR
ncbi:MAG TPA: SRPBCC family protein [Blastocatellia bacterium]|nr:SRPBCC family protein [Blastocatellia bacterium]